MTINRLQNCVADLQVWFNKNQRIMNDEKNRIYSKAIRIFGRTFKYYCGGGGGGGGGDIITASLAVINFAVVLDRN